MVLRTDFVTVSLLPSGFLTLPEHYFCADRHDKTIRTTVPSMSFLLQHPTSGHKLVFDLGIRRDPNAYPDNIQPHLKTRQPIYTVPDASDSLRSGGLEPSNVDVVILSHVHYDHVGTPRDFSTAKFIVGHGTRHLLKHGMKYHSAAKFEEDLLPTDRIIELPIQRIMPAYSKPVENEFAPTKGLDSLIPGVTHHWRKLDPFDNAIDLYGDGLIYLIDSPGHIAGHINLLARMSSTKWVYLAGDACHHVDILDGKTDMAEWIENDQKVCIHVDKPLAESTLSKIRTLKERGFGNDDDVEVILAHDLAFFQDHQDAVWPQCLL